MILLQLIYNHESYIFTLSHQASTLMEISFCIADSAKSFLGSTEDPKTAWKSLKKHFGGGGSDTAGSIISSVVWSSVGCVVGLILIDGLWT